MSAELQEEENTDFLVTNHSSYRVDFNEITSLIADIETLRGSEEHDVIRIKSRESRTKKMIEALHKAGLELSQNSRLCELYIDEDIGDLDDIVERMCQMKFLYEYNDIQSILDRIVQRYQRDLGYVPDHIVFPEAEYFILQKIKAYPRVYPWQMEHYARIIQKGCENWLWKPICKDGKLGIHAKLLMDHVGSLPL